MALGQLARPESGFGGVFAVEAFGGSRSSRVTRKWS